MVRLVLGVLVALVLAGCGGSPDPADPTPAARDAVGGYRLTTVITESTLPDNPEGAGSEVSTTAFLSCANQACTALLQRAASTDRPQGTTTRLEPRPGGFAGEHIRVGECGGSNPGTFGEAFTWTWDRADDGTLTGTLKQVFQGCGIDGATTFSATAVPEEDLGLPYLPVRQQDQLAAAITAYDVNVSAVYLAGAQCDTEEGTTQEEAGCFSATFDGWIKDIEALSNRIDAIRASATGACRDAIAALRIRPWTEAVTKAAVFYAQATRQAPMGAALRAEEAATDLAASEHARLITVAALCTDPSRVATLGKNGVLDLDYGSVLPPLAEAS